MAGLDTWQPRSRWLSYHQEVAEENLNAATPFIGALRSRRDVHGHPLQPFPCRLSWHGVVFEVGPRPLTSLSGVCSTES